MGAALQVRGSQAGQPVASQRLAERGHGMPCRGFVLNRACVRL